MVKIGDTFSIGEVCQESGVYKIVGCACMIDGKCEISEEQYTIPLAKGNKFPPCRSCGGCNMKWELIQKA